MASPYYNPNYTAPTNPYLTGTNTMPVGTTTASTNTGLFSMFSDPNFMFSTNNPNLGSNLGMTGQLLGGIGGLYSAFTAGNYYDDMSNILNQQMGLYQQEIDRRNKTRESYSTAFSDARGY